MNRPNINSRKPCRSGSGYGYGDGYGSGSGYGSGDGVESFNGEPVFDIDGVQTILRSIRRNYAYGAILNTDLTLTPCYVARIGDHFAHGATLREAVADATAKDMHGRPVETRIADFIRAFPDCEKPVKGTDLYKWHNILTGSCKAGRDAWCRDMGLNPEKEKMSPRRFCELTRDSYGGEIIKKLMDAYNKK